MRTGIIGLGTVGKAIRSSFEKRNQIFVHDPKMGTSISDVINNADLAYISVPTPSDERTGECDTRIVEEVLGELPEGYRAVIKSTVIPGTTQRLHEEFPHLKIACSPEFLRTSTSIEDFQNQDILVVGTHHSELAELIFNQHVESGVVRMENCYLTSPTQAELVKYAKNAFYSMKVIFANQLYDYCNDLGEDWGAVRDIITMPQTQPIGDSHLEAISGKKRGFGGNCLPKDTLALYTDLKNKGVAYEFLGAILEDNRRLRES